MKRKYLVLAMMAILAMSLALVACGGGGGSAPSAPPAAPAEPTAEVHTGDAAAGKTLFDSVCIACHGPGGEGITGLGKPFTTSEFLLTVSDQQLLDFIKTGRPSTDPANTTGVDMPPKGGNPALTDAQLMDIIAYVRTLHN